MVTQLQFSDIVWDGHRFTARCGNEPIEGTGNYQPNEEMTGGVITGSISRGLREFHEQIVRVFFEGDQGFCVVQQ